MEAERAAIMLRRTTLFSWRADIGLFISSRTAIMINKVNEKFQKEKEFTLDELLNWILRYIQKHF